MGLNPADKKRVGKISLGMRSLLGELREEGKTILLCSHNAEDIDVLCDEVYEIDKGVLTKIRGEKTNEVEAD